MDQFHTAVKVLTVFPYQIYLTGWGPSSYITLTEEQAGSFEKLKVKPGDWLYALVNKRAEKPEELVFTDLEIDPRPTPTDEEFMGYYTNA